AGADRKSGSAKLPAIADGRPRRVSDTVLAGVMPTRHKRLALECKTPHSLDELQCYGVFFMAIVRLRYQDARAGSAGSTPRSAPGPIRAAALREYGPVVARR